MSTVKDPQQDKTVEGGDTAGDAHSDPRPAPVAEGQRFERDGGNGQDVAGVPLEVEPGPEGTERGAALRPAPSRPAAAPEAGGTESVSGAGPSPAPADDQRTAWLRWRRTGVTATDAPAIVGLSDYASPWSIWGTKVGLLNEDDVDVTDAMQFGKRAERMLTEWFHDETGLYVAGEQMWCTHPTKRWLLATVDGFVFEHDDADLFDIEAALGGFEIKTTTDTAAEWDNEIPHYVAAQVQYQMNVTGVERTWLATLHLGFRVQFRVRLIERDEADIALLEKAATTFWHDHVLTGVPPEADGSEATTRALSEAWEPTDATVEADDRVLVHVAEHRRLTAELKRLESARDAHANAIRAALGEATVLTHGVSEKGKPNVVATWKQQERDGYFVQPTTFRKLDVKKAP